MKIEYRDDQAAGPGYGELIFSEELLPDAPWKISLQRASDKLFLSASPAHPWIGEKTFLPAEGQPLPDGSLSIAVGPSIVDNLDQQDQYAITINGGGQELKGRLRIGTITYSPAERLGNVPQMPPTAQARQSEKKAVETPPAPHAVEEKPQNAVHSDAQPAPDRLTLPEPGHKSRHLWRWAILALLALGCIAWYALDPRGKEEQATRSEAPAEAPEQKDAEPEEIVNKFFRAGKSSPKEALELAARLRKSTAKDQDAAYRLYYFAAENGEPAAFYPYATALDPTTPAWGTLEKNGAAAWEIYKKSTESKAREAMRHLEDWLAAESGKGNAQAREWLEQIRQH